MSIAARIVLQQRDGLEIIPQTYGLLLQMRAREGYASASEKVRTTSRGVNEALRRL
jgi:hypothetical protein